MDSIPRTSGIYKITCVANGKIYVGSAKNLFLRWNKHRSELRCNRHFNSHLQNAWNKYGESAFIFEVIELVMPWSRVDREQYWINKLKPTDHKIGFNVGKAADNGMTGRNHSVETRAKIGEKSTGRNHSVEARKRMSESRIGKTLSAEHKRNIGISQTGKKIPPEVVAKISNAISKNWIVIDPDGNEMKIRNMFQFCKDHGLNQRHMSDVADGRHSHHKGWKCRRDEE